MKKILTLLGLTVVVGLLAVANLQWRQKQKMVQVPVTIAADGGMVLPASGTATSGSTLSVSVPIGQLTDAQKITLLRAEAKKRHINWYIRCFDFGDDHFAGRAWPADHTESEANSSYIEDGGIPSWFGTAQTQGDMAAKLYELIQGTPNIRPHHKPVDKIGPHDCPPELRG
jgi:hypothetical protein